MTSILRQAGESSRTHLLKQSTTTLAKPNPSVKSSNTSKRKSGANRSALRLSLRITIN